MTQSAEVNWPIRGVARVTVKRIRSGCLCLEQVI